MTQDKQAQRTHALVVGVDYSKLGDRALERALDLARAYSRAELHVVHVETPALPATHALQGEPLVRHLDHATERLYTHVEGVVKRWCESNGAPPPFQRLTTHLRSEHAADAIAQLASDVEAELVIVGTHGRRGARRYLLGSVAEGTVRLAPCAVLVVREPDATLPEIEPPCPRCLEAREASGGKEFWCAQHSEHHGRRHTFHYGGAPGSHQSGFLIHTN